VSEKLINLFSQWCIRQVSLVIGGIHDEPTYSDSSSRSRSAAIEDSGLAANFFGLMEEQKFSGNSISDLAYDKGYNRARKQQEKQLIAMLEEGIKTEDVK
jgi:hypothetical protein